MLAEIGYNSLIGAAFLSLLTPYFYYKKNTPYLEAAIITIFLLITTSYASLVYGYVVSDFSIMNVYENSHTAKPLIYKITASWGNHEGSMLLFIWFLSLFTLIFTFLSKYQNKYTVSLIQCMIILLFLIYIIFASNPFLDTPGIAINGRGFNPILQDIGLAIHPPLLYLGYVGLSIIFSMSVVGLYSSNINKEWAKSVRVWNIVAWGFLTSGVALGSWWAYRELGWGGFWFWDPVENSSLLPWLIATALIHIVIIVEKFEKLRAFTALLGIISFSLSVFGFFLVRSGILTSIHSFALDPTRGTFIIAILTIVTFPALILFAVRTTKLQSPLSIGFLSRETMMMINALLLLTSCATILLGTIYPILIEIFLGQHISVGAPYFNKVLVPIACIVLIFAAVSPFMSWTHDSLKRICKNIWLPSLITVLCAAVLYNKNTPIISFIALSCSLWVILAMIKFQYDKKTYRALPIVLSHIGFAAIALGAAISLTWSQEKELLMNIEDNVDIAGFNVVLKATKIITGENYFVRQGEFEIWKDNKQLSTLTPETRFFPIEKSQTNESAIYKYFFSDLYIVIGDSDEKESYAVRLYYRPFVNFIWLGAFLIVLSSVIAIIKLRLKK